MSVDKNYKFILSQIENLKPTQNVSLLAVSKRKPVAMIQELIDAHAGVMLGENYVQEFAQKQQELTGNYEAHLIGPLQSNKVKDAVAVFDVIQSVDRIKIIEKIISESEKLEQQQKIYLQVNISKDQNKSGFSSDETQELLSKDQDNPAIKIIGLMTITAVYDDEKMLRADFLKLKSLRDSLNENLLLSMGMSADYKLAVECGSNMVRVGTAIFGQRE